MKTFSAFATFFILAGVLYAPAGATPLMTVPGSNCVSTRPLDAGLNFSRIFNKSSSTLAIDCPMGQETNSPYTSSVVFAIDQHYSQDVRCTHYVLDVDRSNYWGWWSSKSTSGSNATPQALIVGNGINHAADMYHFLACSVPGVYSGNQSGISGYNYSFTMAR